MSTAVSASSLKASSLKAASRLVRDAMLASLPAEADCPADFSPGFRLRLTARAEKQKPPTRTVLRGLLTAVAAAAAVFCLVLTFSAPARAEVLCWLREVTEHTVLYRLFAPEQAKALPDCTAGWLPEELLPDPASDRGEALAGYTWTSADGALVLTLDLTLIRENTQLSVLEPQGFKREELTVRGQPADLYTQDETAVLIWTERGVLCQLACNFGRQDLLKTAEELKLR